MHTDKALTLVLDHEEERSLSREVAGPRADGVDVVVWIAQLLRTDASVAGVCACQGMQCPTCRKAEGQM